MQPPEFVFPAVQNNTTNIYATNNPMLVRLMAIMAQMESLYTDFTRLHDEANVVPNPNPHNQLFPPVNRLELNYLHMSFAAGFLGILSLVQQVNFTNPPTELDKLKFSQAITECENKFFQFNQMCPMTPAIVGITTKMSNVFKDLKTELGNLGLLTQLSDNYAGGHGRDTSDPSEQPLDATRSQPRKRM